MKIKSVIDEGLGKEIIVILLMDINKNYFRIFIEEYPDKHFREVTQSIAKRALENLSTPAFLIAGSRRMETSRNNKNTYKE